MLVKYTFKEKMMGDNNLQSIPAFIQRTAKDHILM